MKEKLAFLGLSAAALIAGGYLAGANIPSSHAAAAAPAVQVAQAQPAQPQAARPAAVQTLPDFTTIVEGNKGAVVNITSTLKAKASEEDEDAAQGMDEDDPFYQFFRHFQGQMPQQRQPQIRQGMGSGFIVEPSGVILTNAHVVEGADEVRVRLSDRREFKGKVLGLDHQSDIAVVKIDATGLPTVKLGDPSQTKVGEWVLAIGSPFGFENSATVGIVSATSRSLPDGTYVPFIQTDAAVNPGNSGGPLFNTRGEVIGINSQIFSRTGSFAGISFAIPIDYAFNVADQLMKTGKVTRGRIGVSITTVNKDLADSLGLPKAQGAAIGTVEDNSPAQKAGLEAGDVILKIDGRPVEGNADLSRTIRGLKPGTKTTLSVWRAGKTREVPLTIAEFKEDEQKVASTKTGTKKPEAKKDKLGLAVTEVTPDQKKTLKVNGGVAVEAVDGAALAAGISPGDVIMRVNNVDVTSVKAFQEAVSKLDPKKPVALLVRDENGTRFVTFRTDEG